MIMSKDHNYLTTLKERGYRITPQREMIIKTIARNPTHFTADEIHTKIQTRVHSLNIATVYRTLELLVEEGMVCRSDFGEGHIVYAPEDHGPHIHLVCRQCSQVIDADSTLAHSLKEKMQEKYQFALDLHHLAVFGLCSACQKGEEHHES